MAGYAIIDFRGEVIGLRFGLKAVKRIGEKLAEAKNKAIDDQNIYFVKQVLYSGYLNDCEAKDITPVLKVEDFHDFIEDSALNHKMDQITQAINVYSESINITPKEEPKEQAESIVKKNKLTGKKLKSSVTESV
jgi:rubrerythrin